MAKRRVRPNRQQLLATMPLIGLDRGAKPKARDGRRDPYKGFNFNVTFARLAVAAAASVAGAMLAKAVKRMSARRANNRGDQDQPRNLGL